MLPRILSALFTKNLTQGVRTMSGEEILQKLNKLLDTRLKSGGSIYQPIYKEDFFRLFAEAYHNKYFAPSASPRFTPVAIKDEFMSRWLGEETEYNEKKAALLNVLLSMWDEWHYALDNIGAKA
jgi:hypothetical protein